MIVPLLEVESTGGIRHNAVPVVWPMLKVVPRADATVGIGNIEKLCPSYKYVTCFCSLFFFCRGHCSM